MTLPEFAIMINSNNSNQCLGNHFDEYLVLYNILNRVYEKEDISITIGSKQEADKIKAKIVTTNEDDGFIADTYKSLITESSLYQFDVKTKLKNGTINIDILKL